MARLDRYRIGIPRELSEIHTQPWLSEGSLTCGEQTMNKPFPCPTFSTPPTLITVYVLSALQYTPVLHIEQTPSTHQRVVMTASIATMVTVCLHP